ncbi:MAG: hypothetical protein F4056_06005 [Chloroflexi bacterium]|nr:hypothetical protein [Chloroflexota bacterium]MYI82856.1 hypothetical protein [Chloroflexota bacterium]
MTTQADTLSERVTHIEAAMEHLATKADLATLRSEMHQMETRLTRWTVGTMLGGMAAAAAIASAVAALAG